MYEYFCLSRKILGLILTLMLFGSNIVWALEEPNNLDQIRQRYHEKVDTNFYQAVNEYSVLPSTLNGLLLGSDDALELSPDYQLNQALSEILRNDAQVFITKLYELRLATQADAESKVVFSGGGTGSGKTSNVVTLAPAIKGNIEIIYDTTMSNLYYSSLLIDQAMDSGRSVTVVYVYRDPYDAFINGVIPRAKRTGRTVGCPFHVASHITSQKVITDLQKKYEANPKFDLVVVDSSHGIADRRLVSLESLPQANEKELAKKVNAAIKRERLKGELGPDTLGSTIPCKI